MFVLLLAKRVFIRLELHKKYPFSIFFKYRIVNLYRLIFSTLFLAFSFWVQCAQPQGKLGNSCTMRFDLEAFTEYIAQKQTEERREVGLQPVSRKMPPAIQSAEYVIEGRMVSTSHALSFRGRRGARTVPRAGDRRAFWTASAGPAMRCRLPVSGSPLRNPETAKPGPPARPFRCRRGRPPAGTRTETPARSLDSRNRNII